MAVVAPFRGIIYNSQKMTDLSSVITPPYDVISPEQQDSYHALHPYNIIRVDLGKQNPQDTEKDNRYTRAALLFDLWQREKVLVRDPSPAIYIYKVHYSLPERGDLVRTGLISLVGLEPFDSGVIRPHEQTFSRPKMDRLQLLEHCRAQFCPIFSFYVDPEDAIQNLLSSRAPSQPFIDYNDNQGLRHQVWRVTDPPALKSVQGLFQEKALYVADGHHRYETGLNFKAAMQKHDPHLRKDSPFNFTLMFLCNAKDPGLVILPVHRLLCGKAAPDDKVFEERIRRNFQIERFPFAPENRKKVGREFLDRLKAKGKESPTIGVFTLSPPFFYLLTLKGDYLGEKGDESVHPLLGKLDVVVLSRLILEKVIGFDREELDHEGVIEYLSDTQKALETVESGRCRMAFILNPTTIDQIRVIAEASLIMPRKSTFFYPKTPTGLVMNIMNDNESISVEPQP